MQHRSQRRIILNRVGGAEAGHALGWPVLVLVLAHWSLGGNGDRGALRPQCVRRWRSSWSSYGGLLRAEQGMWACRAQRRILRCRWAGWRQWLRRVYYALRRILRFDG